jgi:hypothetical protein
MIVPEYPGTVLERAKTSKVADIDGLIVAGTCGGGS